jgi:hypothetical protein
MKRLFCTIVTDFDGHSLIFHTKAETMQKAEDHARGELVECHELASLDEVDNMFDILTFEVTETGIIEI